MVVNKLNNVSHQVDDWVDYAAAGCHDFVVEISGTGKENEMMYMGGQTWRAGAMEWVGRVTLTSEQATIMLMESFLNLLLHQEQGQLYLLHQ